MNVYQDKRIVVSYKKMSPQRSFQIGADLINFSIRMIYDALKTENPHVRDKKIIRMMKGILHREK